VYTKTKIIGRFRVGSVKRKDNKAGIRGLILTAIILRG
jgi:hypothetical protein